MIRCTSEVIVVQNIHSQDFHCCTAIFSKRRKVGALCNNDLTNSRRRTHLSIQLLPALLYKRGPQQLNTVRITSVGALRSRVTATRLGEVLHLDRVIEVLQPAGGLLLGVLNAHVRTSGAVVVPIG